MQFLSKYGVARHIYVPIVKRAVVDFAVGADWTPAAGDVKISKDGAAAANVTNLPTAITMGNTAIWDFSLTATEMEAAQVVVTVADASTKVVEDQSFMIETYGNASGQHAVDLDDGVRAGLTALPNAAAEATGGLYTRGSGAGQINQPANGQVDVNVEKWNATNVPAEHTAGYPIVTVKDGTGTGELDTASGVVLAKDHTGANLATASALDAVDNFVDAEIADIQARLPAALVSGRIDASVGAVASGAITATAIAADAIGASELAADAVTEIRSLASGTSDSGTTTTMVDAARTEADTDYWVGQYIVFTSGNIAGQARLITAFTPGTDTITFAPATTQAVSTQTYEIWPGGRVDLHQWQGSTPNALASGRVDATVGAMQANVLTASATNADAVNEIRDAILSDSTPFQGARIDATISSRATPAQVNAEVLDVLNVDTFAEPGQEAPPATTTLVKKVGYLFKFLRNRVTQDSTTLKVYGDDATTVDQKATVSDSGSVYDRGEIGTGP